MLKEKHPKYDNLQLIQAAHKHFGMYANTNHALCGYGEVSNFTVDEFKCAIQEDLYTAGSISMSNFWNKSNHTVITATKK